MVDWLLMGKVVAYKLLAYNFFSNIKNVMHLQDYNLNYHIQNVFQYFLNCSLSAP